MENENKKWHSRIPAPVYVTEAVLSILGALEAYQIYQSLPPMNNKYLVESVVKSLPVAAIVVCGFFVFHSAVELYERYKRQGDNKQA